jgi:ribosomal-protein-alanine N-acetyltransferase
MQHSHIAESDRLLLRPVTVADINPNYIQWMNDPDIVQYMECRFQKWTAQDLEDYIVKMEKSEADHFFAIIDKQSQDYIGNIKIGPVNQHHKYASLGLMIGDKNFWGKGLATEVIQLATQYAFDNLKIRKMTAGCYANNKGSCRAFEKAGFEQEGVLKNHYKDATKYNDAILWGKLNDTV